MTYNILDKMEAIFNLAAILDFRKCAKMVLLVDFDKQKQKKIIKKYEFVCFRGKYWSKKAKYGGILKFKMAAEDTLEKVEAPQVLFLRVFERYKALVPLV